MCAAIQHNIQGHNSIHEPILVAVIIGMMELGMT